MKKTKNDNIFMNDKLQKAVSKLISEEFIAWQIYFVSCLMMTFEDQSDESIRNLFKKIADDELDDHFQKMVDWCHSYDYEVPTSMSEFKKLANKNLVKILDGLEPKQKPAYYIQKAREAEKLSLESYAKILDEEDGVSQFTDLQSILWNIFYDEQNHQRDLESAMIAQEADIDLLYN